MGSPTRSPTSWFETRRVVRKHLLPLLLPVHRAITLVVNITPSSYRGSGLKSRKLKLKALRNDDNTICLIRVLLILAIRPGTFASIRSMTSCGKLHFGQTRLFNGNTQSSQSCVILVTSARLFRSRSLLATTSSQTSWLQLPPKLDSRQRRELTICVKALHEILQIFAAPSRDTQS
jgi:hypothetical protein